MQLAALRDSHQASSGCKGTAEQCLGVHGWAAAAPPWVDETMVGRVCPHCTPTAEPHCRQGLRALAGTVC